MKTISTILICIVLEILPTDKGNKYKVVYGPGDTGIVYCNTQYSKNDTIFIKNER